MSWQLVLCNFFDPNGTKKHTSLLDVLYAQLALNEEGGLKNNVTPVVVGLGDTQSVRESPVQQKQCAENAKKYAE